MTTESKGSDQVTETIDQLTALGREAMRVIGEGRNISFFDGGVRAGSGSWGECLTGDLGHKSSGVINRLAKLGLFDVSHDEDGAWFALTELGAAVARKLAGATVEEKAAEPLFPAEPEPVPARESTVDETETVVTMNASSTHVEIDGTPMVELSFSRTVGSMTNTTNVRLTVTELEALAEMVPALAFKITGVA